MIRKSGWLIFLVLTAALLALVYLFAGFAIRLGMVYSLEAAVGAEVNIDDVSVKLAPLAVEIRDVQITDKNKPTHNSISFTEARAALEVWPALLGYYVVDDLTVTGFAYGTERRTPGKVYRGEHADAEARLDLTEVLRLDIPDAEQLLARLDPQSPAKGEALRELIARQRQQLQDLQGQLPDKEKLAAIQAQIKTLTDSKIANAADLANKAEQLRQLQATLRGERDKLRRAQQDLAQMREQLQQAVADVRAASAADWTRLQELANIRDGGLAPISEILLGEFWGEKIAQLESLYRLAEPYIPAAGGKGAEVETVSPELPNRILPLPNQPYPDFWIKQAQVNWLVGGGEATIALHNITAQHQLIDAATRFQLDIQNLPQLEELKVAGDFAIFEQMVTNLNWQLEGLQLDDFAIGGGEQQLRVANGLLASNGTLKLVDNQVSQQAQVLLREPDITAASDNRYLQQLAELLDEQTQIPLSLGAEGLLSRPAVSVRSPLDKLLGDALLGEAKAKLADLEQQLRSQLDAQLREQLGGQSQWLAALEGQDTELSAIDAKIEGSLDAKLADVKSEAKDRVKDALLKRRQGDSD